MRYLVFAFGSILSLLCLTRCSSREQQGQKATLNVDSTATGIETPALDKVFYGLPNPGQALSLLRRAGAKYDEKLPNPDSKVSSYQSSSQIALNIGIYSTDLAYTNTFNQNQQSIKYFAALQKLTEHFGIGSSFDEQIATRLENNRNNHDSILAIVSQVFNRATLKLKKNKQEEAARLILVGGWVEGFYLASEIYHLSPKPEIGKRIAEQKVTLQKLIQILDVPGQSTTAVNLIAQLKDLEKIFEPIEINYSFSNTRTDPQKKITRINNHDEVKYTQDQLLALRDKIFRIRQQIVS